MCADVCVLTCADVCRFLVEQAGADLRQETGKGMTAAGVAVSAGRSEVAQYLAAKAAKAAREAKAQADAAALSFPLLNFKLEWPT